MDRPGSGSPGYQGRTWPTASLSTGFPLLPSQGDRGRGPESSPPNRRVLASDRALGAVSVREDRTLGVSPTKALAALATAGENLGFIVQDIRVEQGIILMSSPLSVSGFSFGFIATARIKEEDKGSQLSIDLTPRFGFWSLNRARNELDELLQEFQTVLDAPHARIRAPTKNRPGARPFGFVPEILGVLWAVLTLAFYGVLLGGWWWLFVLPGIVGAGLILESRAEPWWTWTVTGLGLMSLPFGVLGLIARRLALANQYWGGLISQPSKLEWEPF